MEAATLVMVLQVLWNSLQEAVPGESGRETNFPALHRHVTSLL